MADVYVAFTDGERKVVADYLRVDPKTVEFVELLLAAKVGGVFTKAMAEAEHFDGSGGAGTMEP